MPRQGACYNLWTDANTQGLHVRSPHMYHPLTCARSTPTPPITPLCPYDNLHKHPVPCPLMHGVAQGVPGWAWFVPYSMVDGMPELDTAIRSQMVSAKRHPLGIDTLLPLNDMHFCWPANETNACMHA